MTWLGVTLGGAVGAIARYGLGQLIGHWAGAKATGLATLLVNLTGSFALGWLVGTIASSGVTAGSSVPIGTAGWGAWRVMVAVGLLGGFTTFSAASLEAAEKADRGRGWERLSGIGQALVMALASIGAAGLGLLVS
ncbi:MAG: CrcB family protein [Bifidobacteriaceae bacterium]|jgi:CrcB protein|nr:CrcB family protein [Bifidobacteriaceae bacterium]